MSANAAENHLTGLGTQLQRNRLIHRSGTLHESRLPSSQSCRARKRGPKSSARKARRAKGRCMYCSLGVHHLGRQCSRMACDHKTDTPYECRLRCIPICPSRKTDPKSKAPLAPLQNGTCPPLGKRCLTKRRHRHKNGTARFRHLRCNRACPTRTTGPNSTCSRARW